MFNSEQKKIIALSSLGGAIEFYDFIVFVFFAKILSQLFFPSSNATAALMSAFAVFAVGYFARPIGGIVFGHLGDRFGRKKTFIATVILMAVPTFLIGFLPTYQHVGLLAPCLLVFLRLLQGFSVGGEIPGAIVYASETAPVAHRGLACGIIFFGINMGLVAGSLVAALMTHFLTTEELMAWGWRVPFWVGGSLGIISFYLRSQMHETAFFKNLQLTQRLNYIPFVATIKQYPKQALQGFLLTGLQAVIISLFFLYLPTYLTETFHFPSKQVLALNTINIFIFSIFILISSYFSDKFGRKTVMRFGAVFLALCTYFLFLLFQLQQFWIVIVVTTLCGMFASCVTACFASMLAEFYPTRIRYSGVALSYNFGFILGGVTPLIATALIQFTHNLFAPTFYLITMACIVLVTLFFVRETSKVPLLG